MHSIDRSTRRGLATRVLIGAGLGWIALPLLALAGIAARGSAGPDWIGPVAAGGFVAGGTGLLIGARHLSWPGLIGAVGGAIGGAALPYLVIPPLLGLFAPPIGVYGDYVPGMAAAAVAAGLTMIVGARSGPRVAIRPLAVIVVGLVVLALWFGFWLLATPSMGRAL